MTLVDLIFLSLSYLVYESSTSNVLKKCCLQEVNYSISSHPDKIKI